MTKVKNKIIDLSIFRNIYIELKVHTKVLSRKWLIIPDKVEIISDYEVIGDLKNLIIDPIGIISRRTLFSALTQDQANDIIEEIGSKL